MPSTGILLVFSRFIVEKILLRFRIYVFKTDIYIATVVFCHALCVGVGALVRVIRHWKRFFRLTVTVTFVIAHSCYRTYSVRVITQLPHAACLFQVGYFPKTYVEEVE